MNRFWKPEPYVIEYSRREQSGIFANQADLLTQP